MRVEPRRWKILKSHLLRQVLCLRTMNLPMTVMRNQSRMLTLAVIMAPCQTMQLPLHIELELICQIFRNCMVLSCMSQEIRLTRYFVRSEQTRKWFSLWMRPINTTTSKWLKLEVLISASQIQEIEIEDVMLPERKAFAAILLLWAFVKTIPVSCIGTQCLRSICRSETDSSQFVLCCLG